MYDEAGENTTKDVVISKVDVGGKNLENARLTLIVTDADNKDVNIKDVITDLKNADSIEWGDSSVSWTSTKKAAIATFPAVGKYNATLKEDAAPAGYQVASDVSFVLEDGKLKDADDKDLEKVVMKDYAKKDVSISKKSAVDQSELKGAELTLTGVDKFGDEVKFDSDQIETGEGAEKLCDGKQLTSLKWSSGTTATLIKGLSDGTYTLSEDNAPRGYKVADSVTFEIENGEIVSGDTDMIDELNKTDVNLSKKSAADSSELKGAVLTLTGTDFAGNTVSFTKDNV